MALAAENNKKRENEERRRREKEKRRREKEERRRGKEREHEPEEAEIGLENAEMGLENVAMNFEDEVWDWGVNAQVGEDGAEMLALEKQDLEYEREMSQHSQARPGSQVTDSAQRTKVSSQRQEH